MVGTSNQLVPEMAIESYRIELTNCDGWVIISGASYYCDLPVRIYA